MSIPKAPSANDVIVSIRFSADLETWNAIGITVIEDSETLLRVRISDSAWAANQQGFLRAEFELLSE